jgi:Mce-associated membrane protein
VEDQQPAAGDLSDGAAPRARDEAIDAQHHRHRMPRGKARRLASVAEEPDREPATDAADEPAAGDSAAADGAEESGEAASAKVRRCTPIAACRGTDTHARETSETSDAVETSDVVFVGRKPPGRRAPIAIGVAVAVFVAAATFAGAMLYPYVTQRAAVDTKLEIARTAANAITTLWSYTPDNMEQLADRSARFLGGDFQAQYRKYIDGIAPANKQAQVTNTTEVVGAAVESLNGPDATAIVYTNSTSTSPLSKNIPSMRYLSYRLTLHRQGPDWLVTGMSAITNLDLTPQL